METIYGWLQNAAFFIIFMTAVLNCLPDLKYRRSVRFFLGLVLLIVIASPLLQLFGGEGDLSDRISIAKIRQEAFENKDTMLWAQGIQEQYLWRAYETEIEQQVRELLTEHKIEALEVKAVLKKQENPDEPPGLASLSIRAARQDATLYRSEETQEKEAFAAELEKLRQELADVYQVDMAKITIRQE
ncbi:MAG: stage III sporulation protein AF [Lachnospiraceae bacterium]|nr:stage III sporulation protein AF [Lachnospiraceae bacterium]